MLKNIFFLLIFISSISVHSQNKANSKDNKFVVVLDAGHGGKDPGSENNTRTLKEKDIALAVTLKAGQILKKEEDIQLIYTRDKDVFVELNERANIANKADADLFVSVHLNAVNATSAHGTETFVLGLHNSEQNLELAMKENSVIYLEDDYEETYDGFDPESPSSYIGMTLMQEEYLNQSILLANNIQTGYTDDLHRLNRGVKQAGLLVLRETYMPSVLTEIGFITNQSEGQYLNSENGQMQVANSIAEGIIQYKNSLSENSSKLKTEDPMDTEPDENGVYFKIQVAAGSKPLETEPYNFNGLENVERVKEEDDLYKYYYGKTTDYIEIQQMQEKVKEKGYNASYIVAFRAGKKISIDEALENKVE